MGLLATLWKLLNRLGVIYAYTQEAFQPGREYFSAYAVGFLRLNNRPFQADKSPFSA
jgi:hypothetical protein